MADSLAVQDPNEILKKLSTSISEYKAPSNWQYDPQYEQTANALNTNIARLTASNQMKTRRVDEDYDTYSGQAAKANESNLGRLQAKLANQGIGYSSVNVGEQGRLGEEYGTALKSLETGRARNKEDIAYDTADQAAQWQNQLSAAQVDRAGRQTEHDKEQAAIAAQAQAAKDTADAQRSWMSDLQSRLTSLTQPAPTPIGQMQTPKATVQQAIAQLPPPAAKTPQQQLADIGVNPRDLQQMLASRGFDPGPIDGIMGKKTQLALARLKQELGLPATADINAEIWQQLVGPKPAIGGPRMAIAGPNQGIANFAQGANSRVAIPNIMAQRH